MKFSQKLGVTKWLYSYFMGKKVKTEKCKKYKFFRRNWQHLQQIDKIYFQNCDHGWPRHRESGL